MQLNPHSTLPPLKDTSTLHTIPLNSSLADEMPWSPVSSYQSTPISSRGNSVVPSSGPPSPTLSDRKTVKGRGGVQKTATKRKTNDRKPAKQREWKTEADKTISAILEKNKPETREMDRLNALFDATLDLSFETDEEESSNLKHNKSQQELRALQADVMRLFERYLFGQLNWRGPCVQTMVNARRSGLINNNLHIMQGMGQLAGLTTLLLNLFMIPEAISEAWRLLPLFEAEPITARTDEDRAAAMMNAHMAPDFRDNTLDGDRRRIEALLEFIKPEYRDVFKHAAGILPPPSPIYYPMPRL